MKLLVTLLTIVLFIDCALMILLILMQLPKKEAGLGQAFGSSATDALFGAGSGNVLTKATKYLAGLFFALAIILSILGPRLDPEKMRQREFQRGSSGRGASQPTAPAAPSLTPATNLLTTITSVTNPLSATTNVVATNLAPATNTAASTNK